MAALLLVSCTSELGSTPGSRSAAEPVSSYRGIATFALPPGEVGNYLSPYAGITDNNIDLFQFTPLLYRPLYWFGKGSKQGINYQQSIGKPPAYSNGGRTVTVTLNRNYTWSDGLPVTSRDVELWMNILKAYPAGYFGYIPGTMPDNLVSMSFPANTPYQFSLTFNKAYSKLWILSNQLSTIFPMPQQTWDRTSSAGPVGNYDTTKAGAIAVYKFINSQAENQSTYSSNPIWATVDGPWVLKTYSPSTGAAIFVPNKHYTGPGKPKLAEFEEVPFTSDAAEFDALRSGELDYGYLPTEDLDQESYFKTRGYKIVPWIDFGFNNMWLNYTNPTVGPMFKQLYIRQAMQKLINQPEIVKDIYHGAAYPTYGPIPNKPANPYTAKIGRENPYPFSASGAKTLLKSHGWTIHVDGTDVCTDPGAGKNQCGAGIGRGARLNLEEEVATGSSPFEAEAEAMSSSWSQAGIHVTIQLKPPEQIDSSLTPCVDGGVGCTWEIGNFGEVSSTPTYSPEYLPLPTEWFHSHSLANGGGYDSPGMDALLDKAQVNSSPSAVQAVGVYGAENLPVLWQPNYPYQVSVISPKLKGAVPQDPNLNLYPQNWTLSS